MVHIYLEKHEHEVYRFVVPIFLHAGVIRIFCYIIEN